MALATYQPNPYQRVTVERITTGRGANLEENDTHLVVFEVINVHASAYVEGAVEVNGVWRHRSGPVAPGASFTFDLRQLESSSVGLALGGGQRVGWGVHPHPGPTPAT